MLEKEYIQGFSLTPDGRELKVIFDVKSFNEKHDIDLYEPMFSVSSIDYFLDGNTISFFDLSKEIGIKETYAAIDQAALTY